MDCDIQALASQDSEKEERWTVQFFQRSSRMKEEPFYTSYTMPLKHAEGYLDGLKDAVDVFKIKGCQK